jgi:hypothetical protein
MEHSGIVGSVAESDDVGGARLLHHAHFIFARLYLP